MSKLSSVMDYLEQHASDLSSADGAVVVQYMQELSKLATLFCKLVGYWETYLDKINQQNESTAHRAPVVHIPRRRERPTFDITRHQLKYLSSLSFTWTEIAKLLGVLGMTVYRRRAEFGMLNDKSHENLALAMPI